MTKRRGRNERGEVEILEEVCKEVLAKGEMVEAHRSRLSSVFGRRLQRALETLEEGRVKKYVFQPSGRIVWIVVGKEREYLVMPAADYCSCDDFYFQFHQGHLCYHIIAQKLAEATRQYDLIEDDDQLFDTLIKEWKTTEVRVSKRPKSAAKKRNLNN
jgi:predicted nucleic acid-binding Zn finger protein